MLTKLKRRNIDSGLSDQNL